MIVLIFGIVFSSVGFKPIQIIQFAQVANGWLLPIIAIFLVWAVNQQKILGTFKNSVFQNLLGFLIILATLLLGLRSLEKVFQFSIF